MKFKLLTLTLLIATTSHGMWSSRALFAAKQMTKQSRGITPATRNKNVVWVSPEKYKQMQDKIAPIKGVLENWLKKFEK